MASENPGIHLEVEIKLEAPTDAALPDLSTLPGVGEVVAEATDDLDAVYFDAADLRLIRSGITLRRRTGGPDEGWHLKFPADQQEHDNARLEVHRPLGAQPRVVPPPLLALVRARLLGEPIAPVARIRTSRARHALRSPEGARLAEVADDQVTAEAFTLTEPFEEAEVPEVAERGADPAVLQRWREIEVELDGGDPELLAHARQALLDSMAREAPAPSKLSRTLGDRLRAETAEPEAKNKGAAKPVVERLRELAEGLLTLDPRVRLGSEGAVAGLLSVVRELDALLVVFQPLFAPEPTEGLRRELARLIVVVEALEPLEVLHEQLLRLLEAEPAEVVIGPVRARLDSELGQQRRQARIELIQELNAPGYLALLRRLGAFVLRPPVVPIELDPDQKRRKAVLHALTPFVAEAHNQITTARGDDVKPALERARVAAEALLPVGGRKVVQYVAGVRFVEAAQELVAEHSRLRRALLALGRRATAVGESAFTYGHLYGRLIPGAAPDLSGLLAEAAGGWPAPKASE